jgi:ribosomal-protein-alanine N-acetyltransferase
MASSETRGAVSVVAPDRIESASLYLRRFSIDDAQRMLVLSHQAGMRAWLPDQVYADEAAAEKVLDYLIAQYDEPDAATGKPLVLGVCDRSDHVLIGHVGLSPCDGSVEIGYAIDDAYQGRGLATEAVSAVADWALETLGLPELLAIVASENSGSCRVLEKAGFALLGEGDRALHGVTRLVRTYRVEGPAPVAAGPAPAASM